MHFTAKMPPCARRAFDFVIIGILVVGLEQVRVCALPTHGVQLVLQSSRVHVPMVWYGMVVLVWSMAD